MMMLIKHIIPRQQEETRRRDSPNSWWSLLNSPFVLTVVGGVLLAVVTNNYQTHENQLARKETLRDNVIKEYYTDLKERKKRASDQLGALMAAYQTEMQQTFEVVGAQMDFVTETIPVLDKQGKTDIQILECYREAVEPKRLQLVNARGKTYSKLLELSVLLDSHEIHRDLSELRTCIDTCDGRINAINFDMSLHGQDSKLGIRTKPTYVPNEMHKDIEGLAQKTDDTFFRVCATISKSLSYTPTIAELANRI